MNRKPDYLAHAILLLGVILFALPIWVMIAGATQDAGAIARGDLSLIPNLHGFGIFRQALFFGGASRAGYPVWHMLLVSFAMALGIALGKIAISLLSAFAVVFFRFPFRKLAFWTIFLTLMLPVEVRIIPSFAVVSGLKLVNTYGGLTLPLIASATATLLFRQVFSALPDELWKPHDWMAPVRCNSCGTWCCRSPARTSRPSSSSSSSMAGTSTSGRCWPRAARPTPPWCSASCR